MLLSHETCARDDTGQRTGWYSPTPSFLLALACVVWAAIAAPAVPAAPGDPKRAAPPQELWNAFPLDPISERLGLAGGPSVPFTPPGRPEVAAEISSEAASSDLPLLALAGGAGALIVLALLVLALVRLRQPARHLSAPLWQGTAGIEASPVARLQQYADIDTALTRPPGLVQREAETRSDTRRRSRRPQASRDLRAVAYRMRRAIWNDDTAPFLVGSAIAILAAFLIVHLAG
ncbi:MAG: hypothetical protein M3546_09800 [Actinomycetota bacterium]|nr:hypothetical protein [Actinomycetota bacterium]